MSFVDSVCDLYSALVTVWIYAIYCYIGPRYDGIQLYIVTIYHTYHRLTSSNTETFQFKKNPLLWNACTSLFADNGFGLGTAHDSENFHRVFIFCLLHFNILIKIKQCSIRIFWVMITSLCPRTFKSTEAWNRHRNPDSFKVVCDY